MSICMQVGRLHLHSRIVRFYFTNAAISYASRTEVCVSFEACIYENGGLVLILGP
jgi:hypothetical protein